MATRTYIEVPVTCQSLDVYYFEVTDKVLEDAGCTSAEDLRKQIEDGEVDPFDIDGEWDNVDSEIQYVYYEDTTVC